MDGNSADARQVDDDIKLRKELELLTACNATDNEFDLVMPSISNQDEINLNILDPKSQKDIDKMEPTDAARFNDATISEVNGMKKKGVFEYTTLDGLPQETFIYQSIVNWTSKTNLGIWRLQFKLPTYSFKFAC